MYKYKFNQSFDVLCVLWMLYTFKRVTFYQVHLPKEPMIYEEQIEHMWRIIRLWSLWCTRRCIQITTSLSTTFLRWCTSMSPFAWASRNLFYLKHIHAINHTRIEIKQISIYLYVSNFWINSQAANNERNEKYGQIGEKTFHFKRK